MTETAAARKPRRDGVANRARILDRAKELFATNGLNVSLHGIADDLDVGIDTVYRHFATHADLYVGVYERIAGAIDAEGQALLLLDEPLERVMCYLDSGIRISSDRPFARALAREVRTSHPELFASTRWASVVFEAVEAAKRRGDIRSDIDVTDIGLISGMLSDLASISAEHGPAVTERMRALLHDALRPGGMPRVASPRRTSSDEEFENHAFAARSGPPRAPSNYALILGFLIRLLLRLLLHRGAFEKDLLLPNIRSSVGKWVL